MICNVQNDFPLFLINYEYVRGDEFLIIIKFVNSVTTSYICTYRMPCNKIRINYFYLLLNMYHTMYMNPSSVILLGYISIYHCNCYTSCSKTDFIMQ